MKFGRFLFAAILAATVGSISVGSSEPAAAYCNEWGSAQSISPGWGYEYVQYSSTCDWDNVYKGKVRDAKTDGYCVTVQVATSSLGPWANHASSCSSSYTYFTAWTSSYDEIRLCRGALGCTGAEWNHSA